MEPLPEPAAFRVKPTTPSSTVSFAARFWRRKTAREVFSLVGVSSILFFYGLVPVFGGAGLGLVGADEPRYAQVAREMLARRDYVTPILYGKPWLEKPALYYWRAMLSFREFGVHDWAARLPSATFALTLVVLVYLHMKRFRPGAHLNAALITASCFGILSFARGASTDMQLAAPFGIGMLGWYAWYETDSKFWLFDLYFFIGLATLAKGPVAPFLAGLILIVFAALRREWSLLRRTFWWPGALLYLALVLPWFIEVQRRNPNFLRVFLLQHNLERFATDRYRHGQALWYYLPVVLLALLPWAVLSVAALVAAIRESLAEWRARRAKGHYRGFQRAGDAFPEFLVIWALLPILFFTFSDSKLPGYILPSIPPLTVLTGDYLNRRRGLSPWLLGGHALLVGLLTTAVLLAPGYVAAGEALHPTARTAFAAGFAGAGAGLLILVTVARFGLPKLRAATLLPLTVMLLFIFGLGPVFGIPEAARSKGTIRLLDLAYSPRPLARALASAAPPGVEPIAVFRVRRDVEYGLAFYRDQPVVDYDRQLVPPGEHILISREPFARELPERLRGRTLQLLTTVPEQGLLIYQVMPQSSAKP